MGPEAISRFAATSSGAMARWWRQTHRSIGTPTAGRRARAAETRYIACGPGLAACRCRPFGSMSGSRTPLLANMRRLHVLLIVLAFLAGCGSSPDRMKIAPDKDAARTEMLTALIRSAEAWNRGDLKGHLAIYDESVSVMTKAGPRPGIAAIETSFSAAYFKDGRPKQSLVMEQVAVRLLSADSALMTGRFVLSGGGEPDQSGWFTLIWIRTTSGWKAVHDHTS